ncbi:aldo/keto reductase [soil metagenome]
MQYNQLGKAGIKLSELSFGSWVTFGKQYGVKEAKILMHYAFDQGVNFFDTAEVYAQGEAEVIMGQVLQDFQRSDIVIATKIFWGGKGPNDTGLSRKHLIEGTKKSLKRLQLDYVDLLFCHRPDPATPIEETVMAMDSLIRGGYAFYWGTSEWKAEQIEKAHHAAKKLHCIPPSMEQPQYNLLNRETVQQELLPLYDKYGLGLTVWSPLASGILSGKYNNGMPKDSRLSHEVWLRPAHMQEEIIKVRNLMPIANELGCSMAQMAIAWCLKNPYVSSVILGASTIEQLQENLYALRVKRLLTDDILERINTAIGVIDVI